MKAGQETRPQRDKAATRSDGRHDDPARGGATTPGTGASVAAPLRRAAGDARLTEQRQRQQAARVKARVGSDRGATECREAPRGRRRRTEQRPVPASQAGAGRTRPPPPSKSANVGPLRTQGLILFAGYAGCRSRLVLEVSGVPAHAPPKSEQALRHDSLPGESA